MPQMSIGLPGCLIYKVLDLWGHDSQNLGLEKNLMELSKR
jgi:hypothetical protein